MKPLFLWLMLVVALPTFAQLNIFEAPAQAGSSATCVVNTIYAGTNIPGGLNDAVSSISLQQGYMATLAENEDGTGATYTFIAAVSNVVENLNNQLNNKVSFIRVLPFRNTLKKGVGNTNNTFIDPLNVSWFYDWGPNDMSLPEREYALMAWGKQAASNAGNINNYIAKPDVTHLLSFNEPDNVDQSNITVSEAVTLHKELAKTGLRLGSPAPTESQAYVWLTSFMEGARQANTRVDFMTVHWYDWGSYLSTYNTAPDPNAVFTRFKNYINRIYAIYGKPIWITEFNANRNTTSATHEAFIALALPWLEAQPFVERYAYFFPPALLPVDGSGNITPIGTAYRNYASSTPAITKNYDNTELLTYDVNNDMEAENAYLFGPTVSNCANASGGKTVAALTGTNQVSFHEVNVPATAAYTLNLQYFSTTDRNITVRINHGAAQNVSLLASGVACGSGGTPDVSQFSATLLEGQNVIELTNAPITDKLLIQSSASLPVSLLQFAAQAQQQTAALTWTTAQEQKSHYFEVLRSTNGQSFVPIGKVNAAGNSNSNKSYRFIDVQPAIGTNLYQLKSVDLDGSVTFSAKVPVQFLQQEMSVALLNHTTSGIRLRMHMPAQEQVKLSLMTADGKHLTTLSKQLQRGSNVVELPAQLMEGNIYMLSWQTTAGVQSMKLMR